MTDSSVRAVLFDLDGTITRPILDFNAIRKDIGIPDGRLVLEYIESLSGEARTRANAILDSHETAAAEKAEPNGGVLELFQFLHERGIATAVVTRNSRLSTDITLKKLGLKVGAVVCREDAPPKPSPEPALLAARLLDVAPLHCLFVGDYDMDVLCGLAARMRTVLIPSRRPGPSTPKPDYLFSSALELIELIEEANDHV